MPITNCPTLTAHGREAIDKSIQLALTKFMIVGCERADLRKKAVLKALLTNDLTTVEALEEYRQSELRPLSIFYDKDRVLTARVNITWEDLRIKDWGIEGLIILDDQNKIVGMYPWSTFLEGHQSRVEALIKIHSATGEPGQVVYSTGDFITREEYAAARVPMVQNVYNDVVKIAEPKFEEAVNNFNQLSETLRGALQDEAVQTIQNLKVTGEQILIEASKDLMQVLDTIGILLKLNATEINFRQYQRDVIEEYKFILSKLDYLEKIYNLILKDYDEIGNLELFVDQAPEDYIYFNTWYKTLDYLCFLKKNPLKVVFSNDKEDFMVPWQPRDVYNQNIEGLYLKAKIGTPVNFPGKQYHQQLPNPEYAIKIVDFYKSFMFFIPSVYGTNKDAWAGTNVPSYGIDERHPPQPMELYYTLSRVGSYNDDFKRMYPNQMQFNVHHSHSVDPSYNSSEKTYLSEYRTTVETEHMQIVLAIKAKTKYNVHHLLEEAAKINKYDLALKSLSFIA